MKAKTPRLAQIHTHQFSDEGHGTGHWVRPDGETVCVEIPFSLPNEEILVDLSRRRKGKYQGQPLEWIQTSSSRIIPRCVHFSHCGGCKWQQFEYAKQLVEKENAIKKLFEPYLSSDVTFHSIIPCDPPWNYRNKMEFTFSSDKCGNRFLGLILSNSRGRVFQIEECHIAQSWMIQTVKSVSQWWEANEIEAYHGKADSGALRTLIVREGQRTGDRLVMLTVSGRSEYALNQKQLDDFVLRLRSAIEPQDLSEKLSIVLRVQQIAKGKPTEFFEILLYGPDHIREKIFVLNEKNEPITLNFNISPTAFFQPNTKQAEKLYARAIEMSGLSSTDRVYDLYCGTGTLGICMANRVKEVIGIEIIGESVLDARANIRLNTLNNVTIHKGDVGVVLSQLLQDEKKYPDVVVVDPPRAGLDAKAIEHLLQIKTPKITYISCNPKTQAANLEDLVKGGYRLTAIQPVDQFPQTVHKENIITLTR